MSSPNPPTEFKDLNSDLIHWESNDSENPFNFPLWRKSLICTIVCLQTSWIVMCSSASAAISHEMQQHFGVSPTISRLPVAMFLFGLALGPVVLMPLAEDYGRKKVLATCLALFCAFYVCQIPCALAGNFAIIAVFRLLCGILGSPIINSVGNIPDLWKGDDPIGSWAMHGWIYSAEVAVLGPIIGAYINHAMSWRWVYGIWGIMGATLLVLFIMLVPETRGGVILAARAERARKSGRPDAWAIHEKLGRRSPGQIMRETVMRPAFMLLTEPIVYCFALYDGLNYGIIYLAIEAIPLVYAQYGLQDPSIELTFFALQIGFTLAIPLFYFQLKAVQRREEKEGKKDVPEHKLLWAFFAAILFPVSMFWFAWTGYPPINMYVSLGALVAFAISSHIIFMAVSDFTVKSYGLMASSAVTGQSFARENICGILCLVAVQFYENVGYKWASTVIAILATVMGIFPFLFYKFGPQIRASSRYAQELARLKEQEKRISTFIALQVYAKQKHSADEG